MPMLDWRCGANPKSKWAFTPSPCELNRWTSCRQSTRKLQVSPGGVGPAWRSSPRRRLDWRREQVQPAGPASSQERVSENAEDPWSSTLPSKETGVSGVRHAFSLIKWMTPPPMWKSHWAGERKQQLLPQHSWTQQQGHFLWHGVKTGTQGGKNNDLPYSIYKLTLRTVYSFEKFTLMKLM